MKFIIPLFFYCSLCFSQTNNDSIISTYLKQSKTINDIDYLFEVLGKSNIDYNISKFIPSINPLNPKKQKRVSRSYSLIKKFHPVNGKKKPHLGIDLASSVGTPIHATADGVVIKNLTSNSGYGNVIYIKHKYGFVTRYAHLYLSVVKKNIKVKKGEIIGFVGSTGLSTGNHLHYEVVKNDVRLNPSFFMNLNI